MRIHCLCGGRAPAEQWRLSGASLDHGHDGHGDTDSTRRCCVVSTGRTEPFTSLFSATTVPGAPAITLASPPLAQDPTLPGTSLSCAPTEVELSPSVESITSTTTSAGRADEYKPVADLADGHALDHRGHGHRQHDRHDRTGAVLGSSTPGSSCTSAPGNTLANAAALPASTPDVPQGPPPGTIQSPAVDADTLNTSISPAPSVMPTPNTAACSESIFDGPRQSGSGGVQHEWQCCRHAGRVAAYGMLRRLFSLERTFWDSSLSRLPADHRRARRPGQAFRFASAALNACRVDRASSDKLLSISADCRHGRRCRPAAPRASWNRRRRGVRTSRDGGRIHRRRARCSQDGRAPRRAVYAWGSHMHSQPSSTSWWRSVPPTRSSTLSSTFSIQTQGAFTL
ncbi:hypothetical protein ACVWYI_002310 [Bradyrhizobium sp. LB13.1]